MKSDFGVNAYRSSDTRPVTQNTEPANRPNNAAKAGILAVFLTLAACGGEVEYSYPRSGQGGLPTYEERESVFGPDGLGFGNSSGETGQGSGGSGISVNSFLWRASLDTLSFMPLSSADPFGGVILTDWYMPPETREERFKVSIYILDRALRSDGVRATIFRQERAQDGTWLDMPTDQALGTQLEDAILTRARQLRVNSTAQQ